ncbi:MAG: phosphatase PAP2 family protein [Ignavibacteria bacterium]|nr:phosphatase PAP2 family protein [Ignavibacteria bacterium]
MEFLYNIDVSVFYFINVTLANPLTDKVMPFITTEKNWYIFYLLVWLYMVIQGGRRGLIAGILILICVAISDQVSSNLIKSLVQRTRPCIVLPDVHLLVNCINSFSFPSSHAVNNFAGAVLMSHFYPKAKYFLYTGASLLALSRIFCGVHYPSDVLGGVIIGVIIGLVLLFMWKTVNKKFKILKDEKKAEIPKS